MSCAAINTLIVIFMWCLLIPLIFGIDDMAFALIIGGILSLGSAVAGSALTNSGNASIHAADNAFNAQEAEKAREYEQYNANTQYQRAVADLKNAGLNPMLAISNGGAAVPSGSAASSASPIPMSNPLQALQSMPGVMSSAFSTSSELKNIDADTALKQAQANKLASDTHGVDLDNQFKEKTLQTRVDAEKAALSLNRAQEMEIYKQIDAHEAAIKKQLEEAKTEEAKRDLMETQKILNNATARKIVEMLPYEKLLADAQTETQKSIAALNMVEQAFKQQLVDEQYALAMVDQLRTAAHKNLTGAELNQANEFCLRFQQAVRAGDFSKLDFPFKDTWLGKLGIADMQILNTLRVALSGLNGSINPVSLIQ